MFSSLQRQVFSQKPQIAASLTQSMNLLSLNADELAQAVQQALAENPALELAPAPRCPACGRASLRPGLCPICASRPGAQLIVFTSPLARRESFDQNEEQAEIAVSPSLAQRLLEQIAPQLQREDRLLAAWMVNCLDDDGLLTMEPREIAIYHAAPLARVEAVRRLLQQAEPTGCASLGPQDALQSQLEQIPNPPAAAHVCLQFYELFLRRQFSLLAAQSGADEASLRQAAQWMAGALRPYPARGLNGVGTAVPVYQRADIVFSTLNASPDSPLVVEILQPLGGLLRLNPSLRPAPGQEISESWGDALEQARLLVKGLRQRASALEMIAARLAALQREFILRGEAYLQPLTRAHLAEELGLHESTISRAAGAKNAQLPNGKIIPLSRFFERNRSVRSALRGLVKGETRPLSDDELSLRLHALGFEVARRTVAKYRALEHIPSARERGRA